MGLVQKEPYGCIHLVKESTKFIFHYYSSMCFLRHKLFVTKCQSPALNYVVKYYGSMESWCPSVQKKQFKNKN